MASKQNIEKIGEWKSKNVDRIVFEPRKEKQFPSRLAAAVAAGKAGSRQEYIIAAVEAALATDGFPVEDVGAQVADQSSEDK